MRKWKNELKKIEFKKYIGDKRYLTKNIIKLNKNDIINDFDVLKNIIQI